LISDFPSATAVAAYVALGLAILGLWVGPAAWATLLVGAMALGYASGILAGPAALWIAVFAGACLLYVRMRTAQRSWRTRVTRTAAVVCIIAMGVLLGAHALPGFRNFLVARDLVLSPGSGPYTLYLNFDKTAVGILILGICYRRMLQDRREWARTLQRALPIVVINTGALVLLSMVLGFLKLDPKWTFFSIWAPANLFLTVLSEEAFFRGFIQHELSAALAGSRHAAWVGVAVSAVTFGMAHFAGGWTYASLATAAGVGYALAFQRTGRIEASMLAHFALNATHFLLFTYPRSA
jgi:membrane protease YdiL (CAAX protease family)